MSVTDYFLSANPAPPWSFSPLGAPAFVVVSGLLVLLTLWTYLGRPQATGRRLSLILGLRLLALVVALLTAVRPSVGVREDPKVPSTLVVGIDLSQSMDVPDELGNQPRIAAVRKALDRCRPILDELKSEQNVETVLYAVGSPEFGEASKFDPAAPADLPRSDYGTYLQRTFERWQAERFVRAHLLVGDGADNGTRTPAEVEAGRWRKAGRPLHAFAAGRTDTAGEFKDVALVSAVPDTGSADGSVFVKTKFTLKVVADAPGFVGATVPVVVSFDEGKGYEERWRQTARLDREKGNEIAVPLVAPDRPGEIKLRVEVPVASVPGDVSPANNVIETYLTVTKEGMRVLLAGRASFDLAATRRALQGDRRIYLFEAFLQPGAPVPPAVRELFDFDRQGYDVVVLGNVAPAELLAIDPRLPANLARQVTEKGMGLLVGGGPAGFPAGGPQPWAAVPAFADILPVDLTGSAPGPSAIYTADRIQYLPTPAQAGGYLNKLADTPGESARRWLALNAPDSRSRLNGVSRVGRAKPGAAVYAVASTAQQAAATGSPAQLPPALVGHQIGVGDRGRVLVLAAEETSFWANLNKAKDGPPLHARFWRQLVRWLAHQEEDDGAAFARPDWRRGPAGGKQMIRVGLRAPGGVPAVNPQFVVKVVPPGQDPAAVAPRPPPTPDDEPGRFRVPYDPVAPGEYTVTVSATGADAAGRPVTGEATARFLAYADVSDEQLKKAADHDTLRRLATAGGGKFYRLEDLPGFLRELKSQPLEAAKPKPRYLPDWRRDHSGGFLPGWLVLFVALLGAEWGLRRAWGMV